MIENASLAFSKGLSRRIWTDAKKERRQEILKSSFSDIAAWKPPDDYETAYSRWHDSIMKLPGTVVSAKLDVEDRLVVGMGAANVLEVSLSMNRLWGTPMLPGSGLKGLVRHYASWLAMQPENANKLTDDHIIQLMGSEKMAGVVDWLDAWWVPEDASPYEVDVLTPHYSSWYENAKVPPSGFQDPIPVNFLTVRGTFLVALHGPDEAWANAAMTLLERAVSEWGVGAKTNAGYGYMRRQGSCSSPDTTRPQSHVQEETDDDLYAILLSFDLNKESNISDAQGLA